jgi:Na+-translocating ferredoxin:NAD+ oxidoreductase RnfG subunit
LAARSEVLLSQEQALALAFPDAKVERVSAVLTEAQEKLVVALAGSKPSSKLLAYYRATKDGVPAGTAWFESHLVRTLPEAIMVVVSPEGAVQRVEILAFREPREYMAPSKWLAQFPGRRLDGELALKRGIRGMSGATLTSRAVTDAVRRCLALRAVLAADATP